MIYICFFLIRRLSMHMNESETFKLYLFFASESCVLFLWHQLAISVFWPRETLDNSFNLTGLFVCVECFLLVSALMSVRSQIGSFRRFHSTGDFLFRNTSFGFVAASPNPSEAIQESILSPDYRLIPLLMALPIGPFCDNTTTLPRRVYMYWSFLWFRIWIKTFFGNTQSRF